MKSLYLSLMGVVVSFSTMAASIPAKPALDLLPFETALYYEIHARGREDLLPQIKDFVNQYEAEKKSGTFDGRKSLEDLIRRENENQPTARNFKGPAEELRSVGSSLPIFGDKGKAAGALVNLTADHIEEGLYRLDPAMRPENQALDQGLRQHYGTFYGIENERAIIRRFTKVMAEDVQAKAAGSFFTAKLGLPSNPRVSNDQLQGSSPSYALMSKTNDLIEWHKKSNLDDQAFQAEASVEWKKVSQQVGFLVDKLKATDAEEQRKLDLERKHLDRALLSAKLFMISNVAALTGHRETARKITAVSQIYNHVADSLERYDKVADLGSDLAKKVAMKGAFILAGDIFEVAGMVSALVSAGQPSTEQMMMEQLQEIRRQLQDIKENMNDRFDRVDIRLNQIYSQMMSSFEQLQNGMNNLTQAQRDFSARLEKMEQRVSLIRMDLRDDIKTAADRDYVAKLNECLGDNLAKLTRPSLEDCLATFRRYSEFHSVDNLSTRLSGGLKDPVDVVQEFRRAPRMIDRVPLVLNLLVSEYGREDLNKEAFPDVPTWSQATLAFAETLGHPQALQIESSASLVRMLERGQKIKNFFKALSAPRYDLDNDSTDPAKAYGQSLFHEQVLKLKQLESEIKAAIAAKTQHVLHESFNDSDPWNLDTTQLGAPDFMKDSQDYTLPVCSDFSYIQAYTGKVLKGGQARMKELLQEVPKKYPQPTRLAQSFTIEERLGEKTGVLKLSACLARIGWTNFSVRREGDSVRESAGWTLEFKIMVNGQPVRTWRLRDSRSVVATGEYQLPKATAQKGRNAPVVKAEGPVLTDQTEFSPTQILKKSDRLMDRSPTDKDFSDLIPVRGLETLHQMVAKQAARVINNRKAMVYTSLKEDGTIKALLAQRELHLWLLQATLELGASRLFEENDSLHALFYSNDKLVRAENYFEVAEKEQWNPAQISSDSNSERKKLDVIETVLKTAYQQRAFPQVPKSYQDLSRTLNAQFDRLHAQEPKAKYIDILEQLGKALANLFS